MKKPIIVMMAATLLLSGCDTYAGAGAYTGTTLGSVLGSAIGGSPAQSVALEQSGLGQGVAHQLAQHAGEQEGAHQPHQEVHHQQPGGDGNIVGADKAPQEAGDGAAHSGQIHGGAVKALVTPQGKDNLRTRALDDTGHDDHGAVHVAQQHLHERGQHLGHNGHAGLLDDVGRQGGGHEPDAENQLGTQQGQSGGGEHGGEG